MNPVHVKNMSPQPVAAYVAPTPIPTPPDMVFTLTQEPDGGTPGDPTNNPYPFVASTNAMDGEAGVTHVTQLGKPELGPDNEQLFQSGHTSIIPVNPAAEQGIGRDSSSRWAHYPHVQQFNPTIHSEVLLLDGQSPMAMLGPGAHRAGRSPIWPEGYLNYRQQPSSKHVWPSVAVVNQPSSASFSEVVAPIGEGGAGW